MIPAAVAPSSSTLRVARVCRKSITSKSATNVSASSTNVVAMRCSRVTIDLAALVPRWVSSPIRCRTGGLACGLVVVEVQSAGDHVGGDVGDRPPRIVGVGAQPQQCLGEADPELNGDHSGGLVDLGPAVDRPGQCGWFTVRAGMVL